MKLKALKAAIPYTLPVMIGYVFLGIGFGILLTSKGIAWWWSPIMAIFIYAGSMQYVAVDLLASAFNPINALILTLTVNARHLFYGFSLLSRFQSYGKKKPYMIFALTDETYSVLSAANPPDDVNKEWFDFFIAMLNQIYWVLGCTIGAVGGAAIQFNSRGIEFVMTALFVVIMVEQWEKATNHLPVLIGISASVLSILLFGKDNFIIPAMVGIIIVLTLTRKQLDKQEST